MQPGRKAVWAQSLRGSNPKSKIHSLLTIYRSSCFPENETISRRQMLNPLEVTFSDQNVIASFLCVRPSWRMLTRILGCLENCWKSRSFIYIYGLFKVHATCIYHKIEPFDIQCEKLLTSWRQQARSNLLWTGYVHCFVGTTYCRRSLVPSSITL